MQILVWGFGNYYKQKEKSIQKESILAFISSKETGKYRDIDIISPQDIFKYEFDQLYIMASVKVAFEMLDELRKLDYKEWDKVKLGWTIRPYTEDEAMLFEDGNMVCDSRGKCVYCASDQVVEVNNEAEWKKLKEWKVRNKNKNVMEHIPLQPVSTAFGFDRGFPIDRYYIENFLAENAAHIKGTVLEVAEREYTLKYGTDVKESYCLHVCDYVGNNTIIANLETGEGLIEELADCFILTQTLPFIFDVKAAAENVVKFLKSGGIALVTVPGIVQISRYDMDRWGHYWSFTSASLEKLFKNCGDVEEVKINVYGNVKTAVFGLYGYAVEDMKQDELTYRNEDYQQIICAVVRKK